MAYVDLRPFKSKGKKKEDVIDLSSSSAGANDFLGALASAGTEEKTNPVGGSVNVVHSGNKTDVIELLNLLNEKLSRVDERLYRMERRAGRRRRDDDY